MTNTNLDLNAYKADVKAHKELKARNAKTRTEMRIEEGKGTLKLLYVAMAYGSQNFDLQPLAYFIQEDKPSALVKRIIEVVFPSFELVVVSGTKQLKFRVKDGMAKVFDAAKLQVLADAYTSGDSVTCDQIKAAFPEPKADKADRMAKLSKAIAARMKADNLTKADIAAILKAL